MKGILRLIILLVLGIPGVSARAQEVGSAFLKLGAGARAAALGDAYTAISGNDVNALYWNPAGLGSLKRKELSFTHTQGLLGTQYNFAAFALPAQGPLLGMDDYRGTLGVGLMGISVDGIDSRGPDRSVQSNAKASDRAFLLGTGVRHQPTGIQAGLGVKLIQSEIAGHKAETVAFDMGFLYKLPLSGGRPLALGMSVRNLGPGLKFLDQRDPLPTTATLGFGYPIHQILNLALDVNYHVNEDRLSVGLGTELTPMRYVALRFGFLQQTGSGGTSSGLAGFGDLGGGVGFRYERYQMDYTFTPFGELGNTQRISMGARF